MKNVFKTIVFKFETLNLNEMESILFKEIINIPYIPTLKINGLEKKYTIDVEGLNLICEYKIPEEGEFYGFYNICIKNNKILKNCPDNYESTHYELARKVFFVLKKKLEDSIKQNSKIINHVKLK